ncbi:MAG: DUF2868 domain-containing protein [Pigmentiphaga sp.]|nr:DUF2868 domain-containing protein [Pigmentiphaga sp.]
MIETSPPPPRSSGFTAWMIETVRLFEERHGPCDDGEVVRTLPRGPAYERAAGRNLALADRLGLPAAARRWRRGGLAGLLLLALAALLSGIFAASTAVGDGSTPINLFWAIFGLLGLSWLTLLLWLATLPWGRHLGSVPARLALGLASRLGSGQAPWPRAAPEAATPAEQARLWLPRAASGLLQRAGLWRALGGLASHGWWLLALTSALLTLLVLFATRRYGFTWETTLLSPEAFVGLAHGLGALPAWLGFPLPDAELVARTTTQQSLSSTEQALWSRWLLGCILVWGILPRLLAGGACLAWVLSRRRRLVPDWGSPGLAVQVARLRDDVAPLGVADPAPAQPSWPPAASTPASQERWSQAAGTRQVLALDLPDDIIWPPADLAAPTMDAGNLTDRTPRNRLLAHYASHPPAELLIALDARQTPDRGTLATLHELRDRVPDARLRLYTPAPDAPRLQVWRDSLAAAGLALPHEIRLLDGTEPPEAGHD